MEKKIIESSSHDSHLWTADKYIQLALFMWRSQKHKNVNVSIDRMHMTSLESLYKESSAMRGLKVWKQNGVQILSIEKTQVLTMHE